MRPSPPHKKRTNRAAARVPVIVSLLLLGTHAGLADAAAARDGCADGDPVALAEEGLRLYQNAVRNLQPRDPRAAIAEFERALRCYRSVIRLSKDPSKIYHPLGLVYQRLERYTEALEAYQRFLAAVPEELRKPGVTRQIQDRMQEVRAHVAELTIDAPAGAEVSVDGQPQGRAPLQRTVAVTPGTHAVQSSDAKGTALGQDVTVRAGEVRHVDLTRPLRPAPEPSPAQVLTPAPAPIPAAPAALREKRPRWRLITGGAALGAGALLVGFGASALAVHGRCIDGPCAFDYDTLSVGAGLLAPGAALLVTGAVLLALPGPHRRAEAALGGAGAPRSLLGAGLGRAP